MKSKINLAETLGTLVQSIKHSEEKCEELRAAYEKQTEKEAKLYDKLHGLLADVAVPFTHSLLSNYSLQIEEILGNNRQEGEQMKKELWESQLDHALNDEPFWIANRDVKELKEWIDEKDGDRCVLWSSISPIFKYRGNGETSDSLSTSSIRLSR